VGTGCAHCKPTIALIEQIAKAKGAEVTRGKVVHAGGVPGSAPMLRSVLESREPSWHRNGTFTSCFR
jgi:hypothetical protein